MLGVESNVIIALEMWGAVIMVIFGAACLLSRNEYESLYRKLAWMEFALAGVLMSNALNLLSDGATSTPGLVVLYISLFLEFAFCYLVVIEFVIYFEDILEAFGNVRFRMQKLLVLGLELLSLILLVISQWTGWIYYVGDDNIYRRGPLFILSPALSILSLLIIAVALIWHRNVFTRRQKIFYLFIWGLPIAGAILEFFMGGIPFINLTLAVDGVIVFIAIQVNEREFVFLQERKVHDQEVELLLSQIGPHFLFNSLSTIKYLCKEDATIAARAVEDLAFYLRGNLDSIGRRECISFERELEHTKNYINLEKLRFEDKLRVEYKIECDDFLLPPLTLQPMVENAIKYGVTKRAEGGCVTISTHETKENYLLMIQDDGVGFDTTKKREDDGRRHVGIENVSQRLELMCSGTLEIESRVNEGTTITICIPKGGEE